MENNIWFTSDQHFNHKNIIRLAKRPFNSLDEMHSELINRHNSVVNPNDTVIHLGDFSFCSTTKTREILSKLNGRHILVLGNHDRGITSAINAGFVFSTTEMHFRVNGEKVLIKHYPYRPSVWKILWSLLINKYHDIRYLSRRPINNGHWLIHGHTHQKNKLRNKMIHVGVDSWNFYPVSIKQIESMIGQKKEINKNNYLQKIIKVFQKFTDKITRKQE